MEIMFVLSLIVFYFGVLVRGEKKDEKEEEGNVDFYS